MRILNQISTGSPAPIIELSAFPECILNSVGYFLDFRCSFPNSRETRKHFRMNTQLPPDPLLTQRPNLATSSVQYYCTLHYTSL